MKSRLFLTVLLLWVGIAQGQTTKTVGGGGANYSTLQLAFAAINSGAVQGQVILQITGSTTETASAVLNASGTGSASYTSVLIYPKGTFSITATTLAPTFGNFALIDLNGADNVTIDGRIDQTGSTKSLTIIGTSTGNGAATVRFLNSAENNIVRYCYLTGSSASSAMGIVSFGGSSLGNGNDNNTIENCNLTCSGGNRPYNAILSSGTGGRENNGGIIRNNNIYDTFQTSVSSNSININSASVGFTISGNSIYETTTFVPTANALSYNAIRISTTNEHTITGNYIGGNAPSCAGTWSFKAPYAVYYCAIYAYAGSGTATNISNNVISHMDYSSTEDNPWDGIFLYSGNFDVTGNTIGATTGSGSIISSTPVAVATATLTGGAVSSIKLLNGGSGYTTAPTVTFSVSGSTTSATATAEISGGVVIGFTGLTGGVGYTSIPSVIFDGQSNNYSTSHGMINNSIGTVNITGNNIGSITTVGSKYYSHGFESVYVRGNSGTTTLSNNLIGSLSTANSIQVSSAADSSLLKQDVYGLYCNSASGTNIITGNIVANLTNNYSGLISLSRTRGIAVIAGTNTIQNNTVKDLKSYSKQSSGGSAASVTGITQSSTTAGTTQTITGNTVSNLSNASATAKVYVSGIYYSGPIAGTHAISDNFIHSLSIASSDNLSDIEGIELAGGTFACANNIVNLGVGIAGGYIINGIWDESNASLARSILFNSIYIGGTVTSGGSTTAAFNNQYNTSTRDFRNNVFFNARNGGTGKHYAFYLKAVGNAGLTSDYNDYWTGSAGVTVAYVGADKTLATLKTATGGDAHSLNIDPQFTTAGGTSASNYATSAVLPGITGTGITTDYAGLTRPTIPKMGALESNSYVWYGSSGSTDFNTASNWLPAEVPPAGADITFAASPVNHCVLDQNRTVGTITNAQNTYKLVTNGHQLTINKDVTFSNGAQINATATSSTVVFAGTSAQIIPTGAFVSNTIDGLTLNNSYGLTLNDNLIVSQTLTLTSGALAIGANTLTLNGAITKTSGSLTGGATSSLTFGGTASTTLPALTLNNLTLNRSSGIALGGDVSVAGTLALTSGTLTVGANTLTISGSSPTSGGGSVDASNGSANFVFANASSIALPATFFGGTAVNNMTINGAGGVTAGSDITLNGILNLAASNPSATKGLLEMTRSYTNYPGTTITDYLSSYLLNMGSTATTIGIGDVTGTVKRATIVANTPYTFGHQYTTVSLTTGTMPTALLVTITIGTSPNNTKKSDDIINDAVRRTYEIVPTGGSNCFVTANFHYLESELTSSNSPFHVNSEQKLTTMDYDIEGGANASDEHGRANYDYTNNYIGLSSVPIDYFIQIPVTHAWRTIFALRDYGVDYFTWNGSESSVWGSAANWTLPYGGVGIPTELSHVIIPDGATTPNDPVLPTGNTTINTISIENGGILTMGDNTLTIQNTLSGGWEDQNSLGNDPGTSTVIFNRKNTTISGNARFNNVQIYSDADNVADITNQTNSVMKIAGTISKTGTLAGKWYADVFGATVEYNGGDQTVLLPDGSPHYHNLTLSGSGTKTMPWAPLSLHGNLTTSGTASVTAGAALTIGGSLIIGTGSTFATGAFDHSVAGDFDNEGTFTPTTGTTITMNGSQLQAVLGADLSTIAFKNLTISNTSGVHLHKTINVDGALTLTSGNLTLFDPILGINGAISKTSGFIDASATNATVKFGGATAQAIPATTFYNDLVYNLEVDNSANVTLNGTLKLLNTLTATSGKLDANTHTPTFVYAGGSAQTIGNSEFLDNKIYNLTIDNAAGVTFTNNSLTTVSSTLTINSGRKLEIPTDKQVTVSGTVVNDGGIDGLTIRSNSAGTGSLIIWGSSSAPATVERDMTYDKWHLIGVPADQTIWSFLNNNLDIPILTTPLPGSTYTYGMTDYSTSGNAWNSYFTDNINQSTLLGAGKGYLVRTILDNGLTLKFQGALNGGTTLPSVASGWNCIGNPYTSSIQISSGVNSFLTYNSGRLVPTIDPNYTAAYFWDDVAKSYLVVNSSSGATYAQVGQGFFVKTTSGTLSFTKDMQVHQPTTSFKSALTTYPSIKLVATVNDIHVATEIKFIGGMHEGLDVGYDAGIFKADPSFSLYTKLVEDNGVEFQLQCLPTNHYDKLVIPVGIDLKTAGEVVFTAETANLEAGCRVILEDKLTNTFTDLSKNEYKAALAANTASSDRFFLHTSDIISGLEDHNLPGKLTAYAKGNKEIHLIGEVGSNAEATLFDTSGRVILFKTLGAGSLNIIGLPNLKSGLYMLNVKDKGTTQTIKMMIRK